MTTTPIASPPNPADATTQSVGGYTPTALPPSTTQQTGPTPIGVGAGYQPPTQFTSSPDPTGSGTSYETTTLATPLSKHVYVEGDEWGPTHERPAEIKQLQLQMVAAGLLDASEIHPGVWDSNSAQAYKIVLANANTYGASAPDMLDTLVANPPARTKGQKAPLQLTNPLDIAATVSGGPVGSENIAQKFTGMDLPASETQAFTKWYQDQEASARDAYNKLDLTTQTAYTGAPGLDAAAQAYIKQHNLGQVVAYGTASRMMQFFNMLKTPGQ